MAGFAWFYDTGPNTVFAITSHDAPILLDTDSYNEVRDSTQNPNNWHPHNVMLTDGMGQANKCIADLSDAPKAGIAFDEITKLVKVNVKNSALKGDFPESVGVVAFSIIVENDCPLTTGTELVGDANAETPNGPVPLGIIFR